MNAIEAVLKFSSGQPLWQQDALRRLAIKAELDQADLRELLAMLKVEHGLPQIDPVPSAVALSSHHISAPTAGAHPVILRELSDIKSVNRLAEGQRLRFALQGITLIYGENGSGKSGYCRLLKRLCRAREGAEEGILPDVFKALRSVPAEATVRYSVGDEPEKNSTWRDDTLPPLELGRISVFDAKAAPLYVDRESRIDFLPFGLDLLERLGGVVTQFAAQLDTDADDLEVRCATPLPELIAETKAEELVSRIVPQSALDNLPLETDLRLLGLWQEADAARHSQLESDLAQDTTAMALLFEHADVAARKACATVAGALPLVGDTALSNLYEKVDEARRSREAARLAATELFRDDPLRGVGSDPWRRMMEYARQYSTLAYPGEPFRRRDPAGCAFCANKGLTVTRLAGSSVSKVFCAV